jgi:hypothetical protein
MLRCRVQCQRPRDPACFRRCTGLLQRGGCGRLEVLTHQSQHVRLWQMHVDPCLHLHGAVLLGAACRHVDVPPTPQRLDAQEKMCCAFAALGIIVPSRLSRSSRQGGPRLPDQWHGTFITTDVWTPLLLWLSLQSQPSLHGPDTVRTDAGNAPCFALPRLAIVFFRTRRTVSSETPAPSWRATRRSASHGMVQRFRPVGGVRQASAPHKAACVPSNWARVPSRLRSVSACSRPSSTNRCRVRWTVERATRQGAEIASSVAPSVAWSSLWARAT